MQMISTSDFKMILHFVIIKQVLKLFIDFFYQGFSLIFFIKAFHRFFQKKTKEFSP